MARPPSIMDAPSVNTHVMTLCGELLLTAQEYMSINSVDDQYYRKKIVARAMSLAFRVVKRGELSTPEEILEEMIREMS